MKVIWVRHAETEWNHRGIIQGHRDSFVTHRGMQETAALLTALTKEAYPIECVYSSPLGRALHMGLKLSEGLGCPLKVEESLKEQSFGCFEGISFDHFRRNNPRDADALLFLDVVSPGDSTRDKFLTTPAKYQ